MEATLSTNADTDEDSGGAHLHGVAVVGTSPAPTEEKLLSARAAG
jgi:hypothetical protein